MLKWFRRILTALGFLESERADKPEIRVRELDLDEISKRNELIRSVSDNTQHIAKTSPQANATVCPACGAKTEATVACVKCGKVICESCGTLCTAATEDMDGGMPNKPGYYCEECW